MANFVYEDGSEVRQNDVVIVYPDRLAHISLLLEPDSPLARAYSAQKGGFVVEFDDGDCQVWHGMDEHIRLVRRA